MTCPKLSVLMFIHLFPDCSGQEVGLFLEVRMKISHFFKYLQSQRPKQKFEASLKNKTKRNVFLQKIIFHGKYNRWNKYLNSHGGTACSLAQDSQCFEGRYIWAWGDQWVGWDVPGAHPDRCSTPSACSIMNIRVLCPSGSETYLYNLMHLSALPTLRYMTQLPHG